MTAPKKIAVVGAGLIGSRHIALLQHHPHAQLVAVLDPSLPTEGSEYGVPHFGSLASLFAAARPDGVILATPNKMHVPQALKCLAAGVPALIEKPLAESAAAAAPLLAACAASPVPMLVGHHRRHSPALQRARSLIQAGYFGRIVTAQAHALFHKPADYFGAEWRRQPGGGPLLVNGVHEIDALRFLCGEIIAVQAMASHEMRGHAVEDTAVVNLRFASGALGSLVLSDAAAAPLSWEQTSGESADYAQDTESDSLFITGTHGSLGLPTLRWWRYGAERSWFVPFEQGTEPNPGHDPLRAQLDHFIAVLQGRAAPLVTVADAARNLDVLAAIELSLQGGGEVAVA